MIFKARFIPVCVFFACLQVHFQAFVFLFLGRGDCKYKTLPKNTYMHFSCSFTDVYGAKNPPPAHFQKMYCRKMYRCKWG